MVDGDRLEPLAAGEDAPDFTLTTAYGDPFTLSELRGHMNACLFFYPEHEAPLTERQLRAARDDRERFIAADVERLGVTPGPLEASRRMAERHELDFPLLLDPDLEVARRYRAAPPGEHRVERMVYLIDKAGKIIFGRRGAPTMDEILEALGQ